MPATLPSWLRHAHVEVMSLGWFGNLTLGTAHWILPKHATGPARGAVLPVAAAYLLLNGGILCASLGLMLAGRAMELGAALSFLLHALPRIKPFGAGRAGMPAR